MVVSAYLDSSQLAFGLLQLHYYDHSMKTISHHMSCMSKGVHVYTLAHTHTEIYTPASPPLSLSLTHSLTHSLFSLSLFLSLSPLSLPPFLSLSLSLPLPPSLLSLSLFSLPLPSHLAVVGVTFSSFPWFCLGKGCLMVGWYEV